MKFSKPKTVRINTKNRLRMLANRLKKKLAATKPEGK